MVRVWTAESLTQGFNVSRETLAKLEIHVALLKAWQSKFNLVSASTLPDLWNRHIADSLQLASYLPAGTAPIADLGSGAGFPGLVLAAATGRLVHLVESNHKKAAFLSEVVRKTGVQAKVHACRIEAMDWQALEQWPCAVTARALAPLPQLLTLAEPLLSQGAIGLFAKGRDLDVELTQSAKTWRLTFEVHPSISDSAGAVLKIMEAKRV